MVSGCLLAPHEATNIVTLERESPVTTDRRRTRKNSAARASHKEKVGVGDSTSTKQLPPPQSFSGDAARAVRTGAQSARFRRARARRNPAPRLPRCLFFWTCKDARREPSSGDWAGVTARLSVLSGQSCALGYRAERTARIRRLRVALRRASRRLHLIARRLEPKRARKGPPGPIIRKSSAPRRCGSQLSLHEMRRTLPETCYRFRAVFAARSSATTVTLFPLTFHLVARRPEFRACRGVTYIDRG